ncbi:MAG: P-loop NTPase, partial [Alphaproteobacteria bacterium]
WSKIGITSPTKGVGKTVISVNLAFSMARQAGRRVLLLDLDLAAPRIASILAPGQTFGMRDFLVGRTTPEAFLRRCGDNLLVGLNSQPTHDGAEILQSERAKQAIADAIERARPTVVICDLSPALVSDDALNALAAVDCALMVVGAGETTAKEIRESEKLVNEWTELLGIVLNKSKESVREYYGY